MPANKLRFECTGNPDYAALKACLSAIPGVLEMNIDSQTHAVDVLYDDTRVSDLRIEADLGNCNYHRKG